MGNREDLVYRTYGTHLKEKYGYKVYKIPLTIACGCPNRDGTLGFSGCAFCGEEGGSFEGLEKHIPLAEQFEKNSELVRKKYNAKHFFAYFQRFTNTYIPMAQLIDTIEQAVALDVEGIILSTRPDCLPDSHLEYLSEANKKVPITLELGLQTTNYHTLDYINRGHGLAEFVDGVIRAHNMGLRICTHLILNLPGDNDRDAIEAAHLMNALKIEEVKLHALYIVEGTKLGELYKENAIEIGSSEEYFHRVELFLRHLNPEIIVQRIIGRAPEEGTLFVNWQTSWWKLRDDFVEKMILENKRQGDLLFG
ncbi:MAG: TIGR01212 family radical SAM protein [Tissierellia bacterium]|nr:TIGR01212 family radical SAM protein [Tissierellia bacterium]